MTTDEKPSLRTRSRRTRIAPAADNVLVGQPILAAARLQAASELTPAEHSQVKWLKIVASRGRT